MSSREASGFDNGGMTAVHNKGICQENKGKVFSGHWDAEQETDYAVWVAV